MRFKRGRRIKNTAKKTRQQQMKKVPLALVAATTMLSATGVLTAEPVLAADTVSYPPGKKGQTTDALHLRSGAGTNYAILCVLSPYTKVTALSRNGYWLHVRTDDGKTGWIDAHWFQWLAAPQPTPAPAPKPTPAPQPQPAPIPTPQPAPMPQPTTPPSSAAGAEQGTVTDTVNFRSGASTSNSILGVLAPGTAFKLLSRSGNWVQAQLADGRSGWVYGDYVTIGDVHRITTYPTEANFYEVRSGTLYHVFGTPSGRTASYIVGTAPAFLHEGSVYVRDRDHQFYRRDQTADLAVGSYTPAFESLDLRLTAPVTADDLNRFIAANRPDGLLAGTGQLFIDAEHKYGVSAQYLLAHAVLESGWGTSQICRDKNNFFGYQAYDNSPYASAAYFQSIQDAIEYEAYFVRRSYLNADGDWYGGTPSLDGMNVHYASDPLWAEKIAGLMSAIRPYNPADYEGRSPAPVRAGTPNGPLKEIITQKLPTGTFGLMLRADTLYSMPSSDPSKAISKIAAGTTITVQGMQTNRWYQVECQGKTGFVPVDSLQLQNVLKVSVSDGLNVRATPTTAGSIMGIVTDGTYLQATLDASGHPITSNGWYQISYHGTICYVYGSFVQQVKSI